MLWPWGLLAPAFALIAAALGLGQAEKSFDARTREAGSKAGIGPLRFEKRLSLPAQGVIHVTVRRERSSSASGTAAKITRWYDVTVGGQAALSFTVAGDRDAARDAAKRLSALLDWPVKDEAEDDGVERH